MALLKGVKDEVEVRITAQIEIDNGNTLPVTWRAKYRKPSVSEAADIVRSLENGELTDEDVMDKCLLGWRDLKGEGGEDVPYSPEALEAAMQSREYRTALVRGCLEVLLGREALARKNSSRPGTRSA